MYIGISGFSPRCERAKKLTTRPPVVPLFPDNQDGTMIQIEDLTQSAHPQNEVADTDTTGTGDGPNESYVLWTSSKGRPGAPKGNKTNWVRQLPPLVQKRNGWGTFSNDDVLALYKPWMHQSHLGPNQDNSNLCDHIFKYWELVLNMQQRTPAALRFK